MPSGSKNSKSWNFSAESEEDEDRMNSQKKNVSDEASAKNSRKRKKAAPKRRRDDGDAEPGSKAVKDKSAPKRKREATEPEKAPENGSAAQGQIWRSNFVRYQDELSQTVVGHVKEVLKGPLDDILLKDMLETPEDAQRVVGDIKWDSENQNLIMQIPGGLFSAAKNVVEEDGKRTQNPKDLYAFPRTKSSSRAVVEKAALLKVPPVPVHIPESIKRQTASDKAWCVKQYKLFSEEDVCIWLWFHMERENILACTAGYCSRARKSALKFVFVPVVTHRQSQRSREVMQQGGSPLEAYKDLLERCTKDVKTHVVRLKRGKIEPEKARFSGNRGTWTRPRSSTPRVTSGATFLMCMRDYIEKNMSAMTVGSFYRSCKAVYRHFLHDDMVGLFGGKKNIFNLTRHSWYCYDRHMLRTSDMDVTVSNIMDTSYRATCGLAESVFDDLQAYIKETEGTQLDINASKLQPENETDLDVRRLEIEHARKVARLEREKSELQKKTEEQHLLLKRVAKNMS